MNARHLFGAASAVLLVGSLGCGLERASSPSPSQEAGGNSQASKPSAVSPAKPPADVAVPALEPEGRRVQRSAQLTLQVANGSFERSLDRVTNLMRSQGGYISGSDAQTGGNDRLLSGQVTFQVPAEKFDATLSGLRQLGTPQGIRISGTDVSAQYVDVQARLRNAEAQRDAMLALLQQAKSVSDVIQVQTQLGQITGQIEQLKGQIDYLDHTTTFATVAVTIREAAAGSGADEWGLKTATLQALHNFVNGIGVMLEVLGAIAPLLPLGLIGWLLVRRFRRRKPAQTAPES